MRPVVVAIPARNEADRIGACLAALATQRDAQGAPLPDASFTVLVYGNDCDDDTAGVVDRWAALSPHPVIYRAETLPPERRTAGWARKRAMDAAADLLATTERADGVILTTDADSCVAANWVSATLAAFDAGADAVAGYIDAHPAELLALGPAFLRRSRLEDRYLSALAEIDAFCDPRQHDPWPKHRVASGASLAVTLRAYRAIGGLPPLPVGEDAALARTLDDAGYKVRHAMDVVVSTSCRLSGRAPGGAADTMRLRRDDPDAPCDADIEPALAAFRRARHKGRLRRTREARRKPDHGWVVRLRLAPGAMQAFEATLLSTPFNSCWGDLGTRSLVLRHRTPLTPADLPREIRRAEVLLSRLRRLAVQSAPTQPRLRDDAMA